MRPQAQLVQPTPSKAPSFAELLAVAADRAGQLEDDAVLSLAVPLNGGDPMALLPHLDSSDGFRFLWDGAPGLCIAASGRCNGLELSGPRRFELAQRFASASLSRLATPSTCPPLARPRVLLAFGFFEAPLESTPEAIAGVQAVLPRWQLSRHGQHGWLRLQRPLGGGTTARSVAEELWEQRLALMALEPEQPAPITAQIQSRTAWETGYRSAVDQALQLVDGGHLQKLVLAVRQELNLDQAIDPLELLAPLRRHQSGSCRFLWQQKSGAALLGASPERLLTVRQGRLRSDALAGTTPVGEAASELLNSTKDRHEHALVVDTITAVLAKAGLQPRRPRHPRLARHGHLVHLHTPITADCRGHQPLSLAAALHPTPAVAGLPRREAMGWLRSLEPFERGHYAAPIGWIDSSGDADLRVAIRSGTLRGRQLMLTAGAGLVKGSDVDRELQEVALKLGVLQQQLNLPAKSQVANNLSIV
ncbi:isochorismate synthase [Cyanobium sp. HWJ4-Hawea]|uniref:isochorismate synthase n=1 Tax=Cyanobium sp. HWJ4-Hawea TaxID=2823713 RepID=UPI0020CD1628|nr:isochorismate synthase [Cyanobium sp. HWJ4-Hawea]MCP9808530.1 isochorismate synthase [Cyanobium sp. HWJ4-Hawea]